MMTILIGAGVSGFVLDLGFTALAASLLNGGFLLGDGTGDVTFVGLAALGG
jgi:hypothetical protein